MAVPLFDTATALAPLRPQLHEALARVADGGAFVLGPEVAAFEQEFAAWIGTTHAIGVANGTEAITIALRALGVGPGDEVVVPSFTFWASAEAIPPTGATPVFCDVDPETMCVTPETVAAACTPRTKAIVAVHLFGNVAPIAQIRARTGLPVLEDAAQSAGSVVRVGGAEALGAGGAQRLGGATRGAAATVRPGNGGTGETPRPGGRAGEAVRSGGGTAETARPGALGDIATFSFYPSKNLGGFGDGGAIVTSDDALAERVRTLRFHGSADKVDYVEIGYNSRLDELQAAVLRVLLPQVDGWAAHRTGALARYAEAGLGAHVALPVPAPGATPAWHLFVVQSDRADALAEGLAARGVGARGYYRTPVHRQPPMAAFQPDGVTDLPVTDALARTHLALPVSATISDAQIREVADAVADVLG